MTKIYIYKTTNLLNEKFYIGKHIEKENEKKNHYLGSGVYLKKSMDKYGKENFSKEIIEICKSKDELNEREIFWIKKLNSRSLNGYNLTDGGDGNSNPSKETRMKLSKACSGEKNGMFGSCRCGEDNPFYGKKHSKKIVQILKDYGKKRIPPMLGKNHSEESNEKNRQTHLGKKHPHTEEWNKNIGKGNLGKKRSENTRKKQSLAKQGKYDGKNNPRYIQLDKNTINEIILMYKEHYSFNEMSKKFKISITKIRNVLKEESIHD